MKNIKYISVELEDIGRPKERPPKTNWKIEVIKRAMRAVQHGVPRKVSEVVWHFFTKPGKVFYTPAQEACTEKAEVAVMEYKGDKIYTYKWGNSGNPKVLLCHGWRSKATDFRKMIEMYVETRFEVHGIDFRAHGKSDGIHTAGPEFRDIVKMYVEKEGPFDIVIGHSLGGITASIALMELEERLRPSQLFIIAAPPYIRYFFKDLIDDLKLKDKVFQNMCDMVEENFGQPIDYFDLRGKSAELSAMNAHLIYCENDQIVPFRKGMELFESLEGVEFVQARGFGHYKIISNEKMIEFLLEASKSKMNELAAS